MVFFFNLSPTAARPALPVQVILSRINACRTAVFDRQSDTRRKKKTIPHVYACARAKNTMYTYMYVCEVQYSDGFGREEDFDGRVSTASVKHLRPCIGRSRGRGSTIFFLVVNTLLHVHPCDPERPSQSLRVHTCLAFSISNSNNNATIIVRAETEHACRSRRVCFLFFFFFFHRKPQRFRPVIVVRLCPRTARNNVTIVNTRTTCTRGPPDGFIAPFEYRAVSNFRRDDGHGVRVLLLILLYCAIGLRTFGVY